MMETNGSNSSPECCRSRRRERTHCANARAPITASLPNPNTMLQMYKPLVHEPCGYVNPVVRGAISMGYRSSRLASRAAAGL